MWSFVPSTTNGGISPGFDRRSPYQKQYEAIQPSEYVQWSPPASLPGGGRISATEVGGGMIRRPGLGDFFTYPEAQGVTPGQFMAQAVASGAAPPPPPAFSIGEPQHAVADNAGRMAWETQPAPWDMPLPPGWSGPALPPPAAPGDISAATAVAKAQAIDAQQKKAVEAAQGAKIAADNAVRAAQAGAPRVAATNAATAQAAANVAAQIANTPSAQRAAAVAQSEATKAVAAANVAAVEAEAKSKNGKGMGDWMELSGLDDPVVGGVTAKHLLVGAAAAALGYYAYQYFKKK